MSSVTFRIAGMSCTGCAQSIERRLLAAPGVHSASADFQAGTAAVTYDDLAITKATLEDIIEKLGFDVVQASDQQAAG